MAQTVVETVTFKLNPGIDAAAFTKAAEGMGTWLGAQPGFMRRRLSCTEDGLWIEHVEWSDMASAKAAAAAIGTAPGNLAFLSAIDGPSAQMMHSTLAVGVN
jgi:hypothetical protein